MMSTTPSESGFTLLEAIVGAGLLAMLVLGAMATMTQSVKLTDRAEQTETLNLAVWSLMEEIRGRAFEDPVGPVFGLETGEVGGDKTTYDDVDDFCNYTEDPVVDHTGASNPAFENVVLSTKVWYLPADDADGQSDTDGTTSNDNGEILFNLDSVAPANPCGGPGSTSRFKVIEVKARSKKHVNADNNVAPIVVRTIRFQ
jgi:type II secretory pathway pseudopilin PulG